MENLPSASEVELTIVVPVYNEAGTLNEVLGRLAELECNKQILVVDDGSTDDSIRVARKFQNDRGGIEVVSMGRNQGKGASVRYGLSLATGKYLVVQDADLEYDPADLLRLLTVIQERQGVVVYGSRYLLESEFRDRSSFRAGVSFLNQMTRWLYGIRVTDVMTCYKLFPVQVLRAMELQCCRFEFCAEVTAKACRMGVEIVEVPIRYQRRGGKQGKKLRWRDGWPVLYSLWKWRHWVPQG